MRMRQEISLIVVSFEKKKTPFSEPIFPLHCQKNDKSSGDFDKLKNATNLL